MYKAVVDAVHAGHNALLKEREIIVFFLYDRLFFLLEMASPLVDIAVFESRVARIDAKLQKPVPGLDRLIRRFPLHPSELGFYKRCALHVDSIFIELRRVVEEEIGPDAFKNKLALFMRGGILSCVLDELYEDFAPVSEKVALFYGDIVFGARAGKEGIEHLAHDLEVFHRIVVLDADQVIQRYLLNVITLVFPCQNGLSGTGITDDEAKIDIAFIKGFLVVVEVRLRDKECLVHGNRRFELEPVAQRDEHVGNIASEELYRVVVRISSLLSRKLQIFHERFYKFFT